METPKQSYKYASKWETPMHPKNSKLGTAFDFNVDVVMALDCPTTRLQPQIANQWSTVMVWRVDSHRREVQVKEKTGALGVFHNFREKSNLSTEVNIGISALFCISYVCC